MPEINPTDLTDGQIADVISLGSNALSKYGITLTSPRTGPGKFEGNENQALAEVLYNKSLEGWNDDECGDVSSWGFHVSLIGRFLLIEDSQGFVTVEEHDSTAAARRAFLSDYESAYADWCDGEA